MTDGRVREMQGLLPRALLADWVRLGSRLVRLLRDHQHPGHHDAILERLLQQARQSVDLREIRRLHVPPVSYPENLPITPRKDEIVEAIRRHQVVVIAGETGSGKTTQIPKMCLEAGLGIEAKIGCTQPRRVAALSISRRIAEELGVPWGREVGCKIRFDDRSSPETYIKMMTDGILLAETQGDPLLSDYNAIIIDEAHERSLNIDFLLGYLKGLLAKRPDLKLIITSATIDTAAFSSAFGAAPIIEVSGRLYPVEVVYAPYDEGAEENGEVSYVDAAARAAETALCEPGDGDVLIFMPSERDIRETGELLKGRIGSAAEIIPLFGRLSAGDQQRVFAPDAGRKVVLATNIAETSLTIPGIRYVIDSGLARVSRYTARTRTKRLPIEPVSQSSANQRKGRSGRVQNGVCVRLYSEEDFNARPPYTQPEIQRANLAEVILRMKAFRLGEIETFPFLNPPAPAAVAGGYALLQELGALDEARELTPRGRDLARLPIDPTLGRMLLQSQSEHATRELLIIAAGLSIQDPRERPLDQKDAADAAHRRFADPRSDFLALLNIWNAVHDQWESLRTQGQRRKFCKANFLSYLRMREWQDLHAQLDGALEDLGSLRLNESNAAYEAIHRSILAGLLGHLALREDRNLYKGAGNRPLNLFPGSALFERGEKPKKPAARHGGPPPKPVKSQQPEWIVAGEVVETSQVFARTVAAIDPLWLVELAAHLCKVTHHHPHWSAEAGRVLAEERTTLYGLEIRRRHIAYGNVNAAEATALFIRSAMVEEELVPEPQAGGREADPRSASASQLLAQAAGQEERRPSPHPFMEHNRRVRQKIEIWQTRARRHDLGDLDDAMAAFYARHITNVSSRDELNRFLRGLPKAEVLHVTEADLIGGEDLSYDAGAFPDEVALGGQPVPLSYAYSPGEDRDGVTVRVGQALAQALSGARVDWAVPGLREAQVAELLRALPKGLRRDLMPFPPKVAEIVRELRPGNHTLVHDLSRFIRQRYGVEIPLSAWPADALPPHLKPRVEILGPDQKALAAGRDLDRLRAQLEEERVAPAPAGDSPAWTRLTAQWERFGLEQWSFGDLPERLTVEGEGATALYAWPGIEFEESRVNLRIFRTQSQARTASLPGLRRLVELALQKDFAWLQKDLRAVVGLEPLYAGFLAAEEAQAGALLNLKRHLLPAQLPPALTGAQFEALVAQTRGLFPGLAAQFLARLEAILRYRQDYLRRFKPTTAPSATPPKNRLLTGLDQLAVAVPAAARPQPLAGELESLLPRDFLAVIPFEQLPHVPRYLKALYIRAERAAVTPAKDEERSRQVAPYRDALQRIRASPPASEAGLRLAREFRWMYEEFKVSVFAQELGTAMPVSAKRLDEQLRRVREA